MSWGESKSNQLHNFMSAFCAGYVIFGKYNKVNEQVNNFIRCIKVCFISRVSHPLVFYITTMATDNVKCLGYVVILN